MNLSELVLLVFSSSLTEHIDRLDKVFSRLEKAGLKLNGLKCELFKTSVAHLGHVVSPQGVSVDPSKIEHVQNWPVPTTSTRTPTPTRFSRIGPGAIREKRVGVRVVLRNQNFRNSSGVVRWVMEEGNSSMGRCTCTVGQLCSSHWSAFLLIDHGPQTSFEGAD